MDRSLSAFPFRLTSDGWVLISRTAASPSIIRSRVDVPPSLEPAGVSLVACYRSYSAF